MQINIENHGLSEQVIPIQSDVFSGVEGQCYDLIVSNPPYVDQEDVDALPQEYLHEPKMGLGSGVTASIARFIGENKKSHADNSAEHALALAAVIATIFTTAGLMFGFHILTFLGAEGEILTLAWDYLYIIIIFMFRTYFNN